VLGLIGFSVPDVEAAKKLLSEGVTLVMPR
jgi:hypothetical protein